MPTLQDLISSYKITNQNKNQECKKSKLTNTEITISRLSSLKEKYGNNYFTPPEAVDLIFEKEKLTCPRTRIYTWLDYQVQRKLLYKIVFKNGSRMFRIVHIPDSGYGTIHGDEKRIVECKWKEIDKEAQQKLNQTQQHKDKFMKELAYTHHTENKHVPIEEKPVITQPVFHNLEKVIDKPGTIQISTKKEANKYFNVPIDDKITFNMKVQKGDEVITLSTTGSTVDILRKILGILQS